MRYAIEVCNGDKKPCGYVKKRTDNHSKWPVAKDLEEAQKCGSRDEAVSLRRRYKRYTQSAFPTTYAQYSLKIVECE